MIAYLRGIVQEILENRIILLTNDVGYFVTITNSILVNLQKGDQISSWIHMHISENDVQLYGFSTAQEYELFQDIIGISGIGPKIGMALVNHANQDQITEAVSTSNHQFFQQIPGIGKKNAGRIVLELQNKYGNQSTRTQANLDPTEKEIILGAMQNLGYSKHEIERSIRDIDENLPVEDKIKQLLQKM